MRSLFKTFALVALTLAVATARSNADKAAAPFWRSLNDTMTEALLDDGDVDAVKRLLSVGTGIESVVESPRHVRRFEDEQARIDIVFDPRKEYMLDLFVMTFRDMADVTIPAFRGSLSNCSEAGAADCKRLPLTSRADFTLGVASCLCERGSWPDQWRGEPVAIVPCWLGRGATYLNVIFVFDDPSGQIDRALSAGPSPASAAICAASDAARDFPEFLAHRHSDAAPEGPTDVDPNVWPIAVIAGTAELQHLRREYGRLFID